MTHETAPHRRPLPVTGSAVPAGEELFDQGGALPAGPMLIDPVLIDCGTCCARGVGCGDCVVTVLLGGPPVGVTLNEEERRAVDVLAAAGLIPPLRLVQAVEGPFVEPE